MSDQANNFVSLMYVVQSYMSERGEKALTKVEKYLQSAIEVYSDMNLFEMNTIDTARLVLDTDTMTAKLPPDFLEEIKLGIEICGKMYTLSVNNNLIQPIPTSICGQPISNGLDCNDNCFSNQFSFSPYWYQGYYYNQYYGLGGGFNCCYYKIDYGKNTILFSGFTGNYPIVLEYKSSGVKAGGALIDRKAIQAMKAGIHYFNIRHDVRYNEGEKRAAEERYDKELYGLSRVNNSFSYEELCDTLYSTYKMTPKR